MLHLFFFGHDLTILDKSETCKILKPVSYTHLTLPTT